MSVSAACLVARAVVFTSVVASRAGGQLFVDGAILMNNPSNLALSEAAVLWPGACASRFTPRVRPSISHVPAVGCDVAAGVPVECLVSLGTGQPTLKPMKQNNVMGWVRWSGTVSVCFIVGRRCAARVFNVCEMSYAVRRSRIRRLLACASCAPVGGVASQLP